MAHEIRNPLAIIKNAAYFLERVDEGDQEVRSAFDEINRALRTSNRIVSELLDYARDPKLDRIEFPAEAVVHSAIAAVAIPENVKVQLELDTVRFLADSGQVERILVNLIQNAVHALSDGGAITIRSRPVSPGVAELQVEDNGVGIDKENLDRVFEPLYSSKVKGVGLGLALSKRYAEVNQGDLCVESELGRGSKFRLTLPCANEADEFE